MICDYHLHTPQTLQARTKGTYDKPPGPSQNPYNTKGRREGTHDKPLAPYQITGTRSGGTYDKPLGQALALIIRARKHIIYDNHFDAPPKPIRTRKGKHTNLQSPYKTLTTRRDEGRGPYQVTGNTKRGCLPKSGCWPAGSTFTATTTTATTTTTTTTTPTTTTTTPTTPTTTTTTFKKFCK